jgi:hypothetical protein
MVPNGALIGTNLSLQTFSVSQFLAVFMEEEERMCKRRERHKARRAADSAAERTAAPAKRDRASSAVNVYVSFHSIVTSVIMIHAP